MNPEIEELLSLIYKYKITCACIVGGWYPCRLCAEALDILKKYGKQ